MRGPLVRRRGRGSFLATSTLVLASTAMTSLASLACGKRPSESPRVLVRAYQAFQAASPTDRAAALADLTSAPCDDPSMCGARDVCVTYGKALERARTLTSKARELGPEDGGGNGAATESERSIILASAQEALEEAEKAQPKCAAAMEKLGGQS